MVDWRNRIAVDPQVRHGQARFSGARIPVAVVLDNLAAGISQTEIIKNYPSLDEQAIAAALGYGTDPSK